MRAKSFEVSNDRDFRASKGWIDKFCKRFGIELDPIKRRCKSSPKESKEEFECSKVVQIVPKLSSCLDWTEEEKTKHEKLRVEEDCSLDCFFNFNNEKNPFIDDDFSSFEDKTRLFL